MNEIFDANEALNLLKDGAVLKDNLKSRFICKKNKVSVYASNSSYKLSCDDFLLLFKDNKFILEDFDDGEIDVQKDKEYYSFKHK
jgi:hypothetical protein